MTKTYFCEKCNREFKASSSLECPICKSKEVKRIWKEASATSSSTEEVRQAIDLMKFGSLSGKTRSMV